MVAFFLMARAGVVRNLDSLHGPDKKLLVLAYIISLLWCRWRGTKRCHFEKQTGEVVENTGSAPKNKPERTGKRSGEVVENTYLWKKLSGNEPEIKLGDDLASYPVPIALMLLDLA